LLPYAIQYTSSDIPEEKMIDIAEAMGKIVNNKSKALSKIIKALEKFDSDIKILANLKSIGAKKNDFERNSLL